MNWALVDGKLVAESEASVPLSDRGLLHGAGVFTTMRGSGQRVFRLPQHLLRLRQSCQVLAIPLSADDQRLTDWIHQLLEANPLPASRVRLTVTRGSAATARVFATATALTPYPAELFEAGAAVLCVEPYRLNPHLLTAGHKTLDYVDRLAALETARSRGAAENLWRDAGGRLQSGCVSNVYLVRQGVILTPPTNAELAEPATQAAYGCPRSAVLPGVTRGLLLELARSFGIETHLASLGLTDAMEADECFLTNSIMGVMPVRCMEGRTIGDGAPGPVTRRLMAAYDNYLLDMAAR